MLVNLEHRGACGCDPETGDGAGLLVQVPDRFLRREMRAQGIELPEPGRYAVGMIFLAQDPAAAAQQVAILESLVQSEGQRVIGWRDVPGDPAAIGWLARESMPRDPPAVRRGVRATRPRDQDAFERKLYVIRRLAEKRIARGARGSALLLRARASRAARSSTRGC